MNREELLSRDPEELEDSTATFEVSSEYVGERIDKFVVDVANISRSLAAKLLESGNITVKDKVIAKNYKLRANDTVEIIFPDPQPDEALPEDIPLDIIYEDSDIIVVNKPKGMIVHPATGIYTGTLVNALLFHCKDSLSGIGGVIRPGIVHRIDKDTSGLLVVAKNDDAHLALSEQMKTHTVSRIYHAIAVGNIKDDLGTVNKPIGRHPTDRKKMAIVTDPQRTSREAITHYEVIDRFSIPTGRFSYIRCRLETGRTHQIRVHMASVGHPLLGDGVYGGAGTKFEAQCSSLISGQCLHAKELELIHPRTGEKMHFECELPEDFKKALEKLEKQSNFN